MTHRSRDAREPAPEANRLREIRRRNGADRPDTYTEDFRKRSHPYRDAAHAPAAEPTSYDEQDIAQAVRARMFVELLGFPLDTAMRLAKHHGFVRFPASTLAITAGGGQVIDITPVRELEP